MQEILFLDLETTNAGALKELGLVYGDHELKTSSAAEVKTFIEEQNPFYIAGHNFITFDLEMLQETSLHTLIKNKTIIDTLPISLLLFNEKTFHNLPKNYKNEDSFLNDPVEDSKLSRQLFEQCVEVFLALPRHRQIIFYSLLIKIELFHGFFVAIQEDLKLEVLDAKLLAKTIEKLYESVIHKPSKLLEAIEKQPIELAYILALLTPDIEIKAHPPKILYDYPKIVPLQKELCFNLEKSLDTLASFSEEVFGFGSFNEFPRLNATLESGTMISQREIVEAALQDESFLAVLPTGGGKTFTFWLPALMKAHAYKGLTVVVSPLQALMRNHIDSFNAQVANYTAVALSGYLSALERADAIEKVINGEADILYIAPESLRSNAIFSMLKNRLIERFVIDEAHCLSTWGHDFRHDYFYIGEFIKDLLDAKPFQENIPVSCFTATAKPNVMDDINTYFFDTLGFSLTRYLASPERKNLDYKAVPIVKKAEKYVRLLELLTENTGAALVYIPSSTKTCDEVAEQLNMDISPRRVRAFHSKLDNDVKMEILEQYIKNDVDVVVATTAFGMGVDKPNIETVIHYEVSDSLENYAQEAGRGARDKKLRAMCPLLFDENDLDKHFTSLNMSKVSASEINAVFRVLKNKKSELITMTTLEIAKAANWDIEDGNQSYDTKIKTALLELEREGYLERRRNQIRFFADAVARDSFAILEEKCKALSIAEDEQMRLTDVLRSILGRGKPKAVQVDELSHILGYDKEQIAATILKLKEMQIVSDSKDLSLYISKNAAKAYMEIKKIELYLLEYFKARPSGVISIRTLNEALIKDGIIEDSDNKTDLIKELLKFWRQSKDNFHFYRINRQHDSWYTEILNLASLEKSLHLKHDIAVKIIEHFLAQITTSKDSEKVYLEFSLMQLHKDIELDMPIIWLDKVLLYLHVLNLVTLAEGRFIYYAPMNIYKSDKFKSKLKYTKAEYSIRMKPHYEQKVESIHIMGEYAARLKENPKEAFAFLKDYFTESYDAFKQKYKLLKKTISQPMSKKRYEKIFSGLSEEQQEIINDKESQTMMILAGPGSGKTKVLVHKIASLILNEDIKPEQFLMLTYSRTAVSEFKNRLFELLGSMAYEVDIYTFHGYALQLTGRQIQENETELLRHAISKASQQIRSGNIKAPFKSVLVLDEFQDINADGFSFIEALVEAQEGEMRLIAVGDDDQCILSGVNGADVKYFQKYKERFGANGETFSQSELTMNYRSEESIVALSNHLAQLLKTRYKTQALRAFSQEKGNIYVHICQSPYLVHPAVSEVKKYIGTQSIAVLAHSNDEVSSLYSGFHNQGIKAHYLLNREGFKLRYLSEIYYFNFQIEKLCDGDFKIEEEHFARALQMSMKHFEGSTYLELLTKIVTGFLKEYQDYYRALWESYLDEISFEDFAITSGVTVSTMHKAKGKEFDTVIMLIHKYQLNDELLRLYYVAMTRAKKRLIILTDDTNFISHLPKDLKIIDDHTAYEAPRTKTFIMSLKDIHLGFSGRQNFVDEELIAGSKVTMKLFSNNIYHIFIHDEPIERLSIRFDTAIKEHLALGYKITDVEIDSVVIWQDIERKEAIKHALCKIILKK